MVILLVFLICFFASVVGAICGIGGGVIIKPALDAFGIMEVATISFLSGCTVLSMTTYSVIKSRRSGSSAFDKKTGLPLAIGAAVGGVVGKQSNAVITTYVENSAQVTGDETYIRNQGETNYNVDTDKKQVERIAGIVTDLSVSVSINRAVSGDVNVDILMRHIARAAGIGADAQEDKISILVMPFYQAEKEPGLVTPAGLNLPAWALYAGIGGVALLLFILLLLLLLRKRRKKRKQAEVERIINSMPRPMGDAVEPEPEGGADIMNIRTEKSMLLRQDIRKFAESNPEIAAQMLKNWLRGGEENE